MTSNVTFTNVQILVSVRSSFQTGGRWQIRQPVKQKQNTQRKLHQSWHSPAQRTKMQEQILCSIVKEVS